LWPYLKSGRNTWGGLVNVEQPQVRRFVIENALMWLRDFHVDALRLDAVHALHDSTPTHVLAELSTAVDALSVEFGRPLTLIAESDLNDPVMITPRSAGGYGLAAQWDDDVHHALHALLTGETQGYYCDFGSLQALAKVFTSAFFHDGTYSTFRGRPGIYLEDLFVDPTYRGLGIGKALLVHLARLAQERDCGRFEWSVLDWNAPSIAFYEAMGADVLPEWRICRATGNALEKMAAMPMPTGLAAQD